MEWDDMLMGMASKHKNLEDLLSTVFSFFERRTDLFHVMQTRDEKMGFPPGVAKRMVLSQFEKYEDVYQKRTGNKAPEGLLESDVVNKPMGTAPRLAHPPPAPAPMASNAATSQPSQLPDDHAASHISTWNGAVTDRYRWSQSLTETTIEIPIATDEKVKAKELIVEIGTTTLSIRRKMIEDGSVMPILEGKFPEKVDAGESLWNLEDGKKVVLSLEKLKKTWWACAFEGDETIDTTKVESTKKVHEYDEQTQGAIRKIMFDQNQKAKGEPTSDQLRTAEIMKGAWNAEGSPFKGTPFDPTQLNLNGTLPDEMMFGKKM